MKLTVLGWMVCCMVVWGWFTTSETVARELMLYLPFDEGSGEVANDLSPNGYEAMLNGGAAFSNDAKSGSSVELSGGQSHVAIEEFNLDPIGSTNQITLGAWFKSMTHSGWDGVVSIEVPGGDCCEFRMLLSNANPPVPFWNAGHHTDRTGTFQFDLNTWYHYVMTYDGADAHIYVDGTEVDSSTEEVDLPTGPSTFFVGVGESPGTHPMESGVIDEIFAYDEALSAEEIAGIMANGVTAVDARNKLASVWGAVKVAR